MLILTTTEPGNPFPENFSCWCAGALEAKGCDTALETISLEKLIQCSSSEPLEIQQEKLTALQDTLSIIEKLVLILPEHNHMIPVGLDNFMELASTMKNKYKLCKLIAIVMDLTTDKDKDKDGHLLFRYPLHKLDTLFGSTFSANRIQIKNSPTGNMCPLFAESYSDLCQLIQQILA
ncbi:NAD(P)H-dependent oxidoreductase [Cardinium endosymbiont of Oedothorax gibbosus]|uniref:NAD(P)H-dependent oxidoreductase n=1 Tax=Cardinium endosymbiont of Oedothorax gibbosus TaxID=931101 RepID=UPI0020252B88|nr:NAD(P)H-dependent oxidoreductase [Cardinium endosymbiont of Oedothorax gibbosus]